MRAVEPTEALAEQARRDHPQHPPTTPEGSDSWCYRCRLRWPCDAVRLAEALEELQAHHLEIVVQTHYAWHPMGLNVLDCKMGDCLEHRAALVGVGAGGNP